MYPILFEFGAFKIYSYGVMIALGFLISMYLTSREAGRAGIAPENIFDIWLYAILFGIVGARVLHVLLDLSYYTARPLDIIMINRGGLAFHGGLIAGIIAVWFFIRRNRMPLWKTADVIMPYIALGQAIGRIGCLLNGCCYGTPTYLPIGIRLAGHLQRLHPTQLYSSIFLFLTFFALKRIYRKKRFDGVVFFSYLLIFSAGRFFIDFFRGDLSPVFLGLKTSQLISIGIFFCAVIFLTKGVRSIFSPIQKKGKKNRSDPFFSFYRK